jgi:hypothetical protein
MMKRSGNIYRLLKELSLFHKSYINLLILVSVLEIMIKNNRSCDLLLLYIYILFIKIIICVYILLNLMFIFYLIKNFNLIYLI